MSSEYGWDDETIWNLPLCRFRQITATIQQRRYMASREENGRFSWLARSLASFIAAGYMVDKGKENPALDSAAQLAFDEIESVLLGSKTESAPAKLPVGPDGKVADIDPNEAIERALARNSNGSFERFAGMVQGLEMRGKML